MRIWPFEPNWRESVSETLEWLTDVMASETDAEQRMALRSVPRRQVEATFSRWSSDRRKLFNTITALQREPFWLPLWWQGQYIGATLSGQETIAVTNLGYEFTVGSRVMVSDGDFRQISEIIATTPYSVTIAPGLSREVSTEARITPVREAQMFDPPDMNNLTSNVTDMRIRFTIIDQRRVFIPLSLEGDRLWNIQPNWSSGIQTSQITNVQYILDNNVCAPRRYIANDQTQYGMRLHLVFRNEVELLAIMRRVSWMQGRLKAFRIPTFTNDLVPTSSIVGTTINVESVGYEENDLLYQSICQHILIRTESGNYVRRITRVQQGATGEVLTVDSSLPLIRADNVISISYIPKTRMDADAVEIDRLTSTTGTVSLTFKLFDDRRSGDPVESDGYLMSFDGLYLVSSDGYQLRGADEPVDPDDPLFLKSFDDLYLISSDNYLLAGSHLTDINE